jgi:hypothetical protein
MNGTIYLYLSEDSDWIIKWTDFDNYSSVRNDSSASVLEIVHL